MSQTRTSYRVTFQHGVTMVLSFPGDLPKVVFDAADRAAAAGSKPGLLLLDDPRMVLDMSTLVAVHQSAAGSTEASA